MSAQAVALLRKALQPAVDRTVQQRIAAERLQEIRHRNRLTGSDTPSEALVRQDRDTAR